MAVTITSCDYVTPMTKLDLVEVMEWTAESGHEAVFGLCRELGATNLKSAMAWAVKGGRDIMRLFLDWVSPVSSYPWPGHQTTAVKI